MTRTSARYSARPSDAIAHGAATQRERERERKRERKRKEGGYVKRQTLLSYRTRRATIDDWGHRR